MSPWKPLANLQDIVSFQAKEVEETIEGLLLGLEEFCSLADMVSEGLAGRRGSRPGPGFRALLGLPGEPSWRWLSEQEAWAASYKGLA